MSEKCLHFQAGALGLSAGVMLYVSFVEIYVKSQLAFEASSVRRPRSRLKKKKQTTRAERERERDSARVSA